jgi:hypothetical protein
MTTRPEISDQPLELLRQVNPIPEAPVTPGVDEALGEVARAITRQPFTTRSTRTSRRSVVRPRLRVALAVGLVALVGGSVATAAVALHAHTGIFASGADVQPGGPGENLNLAAPDFRSVALRLSADIPYPAGYASWRDWVLTEQAPGPGGATTGDQVTTGARAPNWSAVTAEDPHPSASAANDPGAEPGTLFGWMIPYRSAVLAGDPAAVDQMLASGYGDGKCWLSDPQWMSELHAHSTWAKLSPQGLARRYQQFLARERS